MRDLPLGPVELVAEDQNFAMLRVEPLHAGRDGARSSSVVACRAGLSYSLGTVTPARGEIFIPADYGGTTAKRVGSKG